MSKDDTDNKNGQKNDIWEERETEIIEPTETLIQEARRTAIDNNEDAKPTKPPAADPPAVDAPKPDVEIQSRSSRAPVRIQLETSAPPANRSSTILLCIGVALIAFLLGFLPLSIYSNQQKEESDHERANLKLNLGICGEYVGQALGELAECVRDFEQLSGSTAPMGLAPRNALVEKKRVQKETSAAALAETQDAILSRLEGMKKASQRSGKRWKALQKDVAQLRGLIEQSQRTEREYQVALRKSMTPTVKAADVKLTARNKKRAAYLKEAESTLAAPSWLKGIQAP